jgi:hypothetical protein
MKSAVGDTDFAAVTSFHGSQEIRVLPFVGFGGRTRTHTCACTRYPAPSVGLGESTVTVKCSKVAVWFIARRVPFGVSGVDGGDAVTVVVTVTGVEGVTVGVTVAVATVVVEASAEGALEEGVLDALEATPDGATCAPDSLQPARSKPAAIRHVPAVRRGGIGREGGPGFQFVMAPPLETWHPNRTCLRTPLR